MIRSWSESAAHIGAWVGFNAGCLAARIFPRQWLYRFADILADVGFYFFRGFRMRSLKNVGLALGKKLTTAQVEEIVRKSLQNFFRDFVEIAVALVISAEKLRAEIPIEGRENLEAALSKGHARPRREALRELNQVLRANELAVVIADEYRRNNGIHMPFFGRTVLARRGPATLALRTGAAVVPVYLIHDKNHGLKMIVESELDLIRTDKDKGAIRENTLRMTQWLEKTVRAYPEQWNWMNIHWQEDQDKAAVVKEQRVQGVTS